MMFDFISFWLLIVYKSNLRTWWIEFSLSFSSSQSPSTQFQLSCLSIHTSSRFMKPGLNSLETADDDPVSWRHVAFKGCECYISLRVPFFVCGTRATFRNDALLKEPVCLSPHWIITALVTLSPHHQQTPYTWQRYNTLTHASSSITIHAHARHIRFVLLLNFGAYLSPNYQKSCLINYFFYYTDIFL